MKKVPRRRSPKNYFPVTFFFPSEKFLYYMIIFPGKNFPKNFFQRFVFLNSTFPIRTAPSAAGGSRGGRGRTPTLFRPAKNGTFGQSVSDAIKLEPPRAWYLNPAGGGTLLGRPARYALNAHLPSTTTPPPPTTHQRRNRNPLDTRLKSRVDLSLSSAAPAASVDPQQSDDNCDPSS